MLRSRCWMVLTAQLLVALVGCSERDDVVANWLISSTDDPPNAPVDSSDGAVPAPAPEAPLLPPASDPPPIVAPVLDAGTCEPVDVITPLRPDWVQATIDCVYTLPWVADTASGEPWDPDAAIEALYAPTPPPVPEPGTTAADICAAPGGVVYSDAELGPTKLRVCPEACQGARTLLLLYIAESCGYTEELTAALATLRRDAMAFPAEADAGI